MNKNYIWNPKVKGSGIITAIPQRGRCPNKCEDCFFQSGRSYLEPLQKNLPHLPPVLLTKNRIVRINDGNDSNINRRLVEKTVKKYKHYFFNTAIPKNLNKFSKPVVLTINPGKMTDIFFYKIEIIPDNLMFVRIRTNTWNLHQVVEPAVCYYAEHGVVIVLTFMAYYTNKILDKFKESYHWKKRTLNSYWCLKQPVIDEIVDRFKNNPFVYSCGIKGRHECMFCGNCIREYFNAKERMAGICSRIKLK